MYNWFKKYRKFALILSLGIFTIYLWFWTNPTSKTKGTIKIYDRNENLIYETSDPKSSNPIGHQESVSISKVPKDLQNAVVSIEDERFWDHLGIDPQGILRAVWQNLIERKIVSGASTIPQQLVRFTVISPQTTPRVSFIRKIRESLMAFRLTLTTPKEKILENYLNSMYFGRNTFGVAAASRLYFAKSVENLSLAQSALLAAMISNPSAYDPINYPSQSLRRRNMILEKMFNNKYISKETYDRSLAEALPSDTSELEVTLPHAVQMVLQELIKRRMDTSYGVLVYTTLDSDWYKLVRNIAAINVGKLHEEHDLSNAAVVVIKNETGEIITLLGSVNYFDQSIAGQNNMVLAERQPGSAMKPVTYAAAFEDKIATPATVIDDSPKVYLTSKGEGFLPHNYDGRYRGVVLTREALASSYNLPAVEMLSRVGIERFLNLAHKMGISSMRETDRYDLALTLGGGEVNLLELTNLYATFARNGIWRPTVIIQKVVTDSGKVLYQEDNIQQHKAIDEKVAYLITDILSDKNARIPTFGQKNLLALGTNVAVKTGTTTDWHDNWTVGYTPDYTVGVWVGNADNHPMKDITGITGAAPVWNQVMQNILKYYPQGNFKEPEGITEKMVCSWDGLLAGNSCTQRYLEKFIAGTEPQEYSNLNEKPKFLTSSDIQIISPVEETNYEIGSKPDEKINFELTHYDGINKLIWVLDGKILTEKDCQNIFVCHWTPILGKHILKVQTEPPINEIKEVHFSVGEYKEGW